MKIKAEDKNTLIEQLRLIADRLVTEGEKIPEEDLIIEYDNGGGQSGVRENPFYPAYEKLLASYTKTLKALESMTDRKDSEVTSLRELQAKFKIAK